MQRQAVSADVEAAPIRVSLLGGLSLSVGDRQLPAIRSHRLESLIGWLVTHAGQPQEREVIARVLWPHSTPDQRRTNVRNLLHRLRAAMPREALRRVVLERQTVTWAAGAADYVDVVELRRLLPGAAHDRALLERVLSVYAGDLLPRCDDEWVRAERARLFQAVRLNVEHWRARAEAVGDHVDAVRLAAWEVAHDPLGEQANRRLIRALGEARDHAGLRRAYGAYEKALRRDPRAEPAAGLGIYYEETRRAALVAPPPVIDRVEAETAVSGAQDELAVRVPPFSSGLPAVPTGFVGRDVEIVDALSLLSDPDVRLLTLSGPAGVGKTRLAIELARSLVRPGGTGIVERVAFVPLAGVRDPGAVGSAIADALHVTARSSTSAIADVAATLSRTRALLVLDNFEHLRAGAPALGELLSGAAGLKLLVTSRAPLRIYGEHVLEVPPLGLPSSGAARDEIARTDAVALFVQRARAAQLTFALTADNAGVVATICRRLDGLPLAIELAAARVAAMSVDEMLERLERRLTVATGGPVDVPRRHRTLRAALAWSHDLLAEREARVFRRLAVFADGWTLEAAQSVCGLEPEIDMSAVLDRLIEHHLVQHATSAGRGRFMMLQTIRDFAADEFERSTEQGAVAQRHAHYFAAIADEARVGIEGAEHSHWMETLARENDNVRAALSWALAADESDTAARIAACMGRFWYRRGQLVEGRRWLGAVLESGEGLSATLLAPVARWAGVLAHEHGDSEQALELYQRALSLAREAGDKPAAAAALNALGMAAQYTGELHRALELYGEALELHRSSGIETGEMATLGNLAQVSSELGRLDEAVKQMDRAVALAAGTGDAGLRAVYIVGRADVERFRGAYDRAIELYEEGLEVLRERGDSLEVASAVRQLAIARLERSEVSSAKALFAEASSIAADHDLEWVLAEDAEGLARVALAEGDLGDAARLSATALDAHRRLQYPQGITRSLLTMGRIALARGERDQAGAAHREVLEISRRTGEVAATAAALEALAEVEASQRPEVAARLVGAAAALRSASGLGRPPSDEPAYGRTSEAIASRLSEGERHAAEQVGRSMPLADLLAELSPPRQPGGQKT